VWSTGAVLGGPPYRPPAHVPAPERRCLRVRALTEGKHGVVGVGGVDPRVVVSQRRKLLTVGGVDLLGGVGEEEVTLAECVSGGVDLLLNHVGLGVDGREVRARLGGGACAVGEGGARTRNTMEPATAAAAVIDTLSG
jgi:hypothetical protein